MTLFLILAAVKSALLLAAAAAAARLARSPAARHQVWAVAFGVLLVLPLASLLLPAQGDAWRALTSIVGEPPARAAPQAALPEAPLPTPLRLPATAAAVAVGGASTDAVLTTLWLLGAAAFAGRLAADRWRLRRLIRQARPAPSSLAALARTRVLVSRDVAAPAVAGVWRPVVLLPEAALHWPPARVRAALAHEAAHLARRDTLTAFAADLCCALYWFNPLVWRARRRLEAECERACDDRVLAGGADAYAYADALLASARDAAGRRAGAAILAMASSSGLEQRIRLVIDGRPRRLRRRGLSLGLLAGCMLLAPLAAVRPSTAGTEAPGPDRSPSHYVLVDPRSERLDLDYEALAIRAGSVEARGRDGLAIATLKRELSRRPQGIDDLVRERSIWALLQVRDGRLVEPLLDALGHGDWRTRAYAAWGLGVAGSAAAVPGLTEALSDPVWRVRANAAFALAEIGGEAPEPAMTAALSDPVWQVRYAAVTYFAEQPEPLRRRRLSPVRDDPHMGTRMAAQAALSGAAR